MVEAGKPFGQKGKRQMKRAPRVIADRKIKFAVVGCGRISANHFGSIVEHKDHAELVAVCDIDPAALSEITAKSDVKGYSSLTDLLLHSDAEVVAAAGPATSSPVTKALPSGLM